MDRKPKVSIVIPVYQMDNSTAFLKRNLDSIQAQKFTDYEIVVSDDSPNDTIEIFCKNYPVRYIRHKGVRGMATNTNHAIDQARGELIKILFQDDYFFRTDSLTEIVEHFTPTFNWLVTGCTHQVNFEYGVLNNHQPFYSESENTIGSPSVLTIRNTVRVRFDPQFTWVLDLDLYKRLFREHGRPKVLNDINVVIGLGSHQTTNKLTDAYKAYEHQKLRQKYDTSIATLVG